MDERRVFHWLVQQASNTIPEIFFASQVALDKMPDSQHAVGALTTLHHQGDGACE